VPTNLFGTLSPEQLEQQVAPGKNRLIYLWGHLAAVNDGLLPLLGIGERLHPELTRCSFRPPDRSVETYGAAQSLKSAWDKINEKLWEGFARSSRRRDWGGGGMPPFSEEEFKRERIEAIHRAPRSTAHCRIT